MSKKVGRPRTKQRCIRKDQFNELPTCWYRVGIYCYEEECKGTDQCPLKNKGEK